MVIVDVANKVARTIGSEFFYNQLQKKFEDSGFSKEMAGKATNEILLSMEYPQYSLIVKYNGNFFSLDMYNRKLEKIEIIQVLPTQSTEFGEKYFQEANREYLQRIQDFSYGDQEELTHGAYLYYKYSEIIVYSTDEIVHKDFEDMLSNYFSKEGLHRLADDFIRDFRGDGVCIRTQQIVSVLKIENGNLVFSYDSESDVTEKLRKIISVHLNGYNRYMDEIFHWLYNYAIHDMTINMPYKIFGVTSEFVFAEVDGYPCFTYKKINHEDTKNKPFWYRCRPLSRELIKTIIVDQQKGFYKIYAEKIFACERKGKIYINDYTPGFEKVKFDERILPDFGEKVPKEFEFIMYPIISVDFDYLDVEDVVNERGKLVGCIHLLSYIAEYWRVDDKGYLDLYRHTFRKGDMKGLLDELESNIELIHKKHPLFNMYYVDKIPMK